MAGGTQEAGGGAGERTGLAVCKASVPLLHHRSGPVMLFLLMWLTVMLCKNSLSF